MFNVFLHGILSPLGPIGPNEFEPYPLWVWNGLKFAHEGGIDELLNLLREYFEEPIDYTKQDLIAEYEKITRKAGESVALFARFGCPPIVDFEWRLTDEELCPTFAATARRAILDDPDIETVVLVSRMALFAEGWLDDVGFGDLATI